MVPVNGLLFAVYQRRKQRRGVVVPLLQSRRITRRNGGNKRIKGLEPGTVRNMQHWFRSILARVDKVFASNAVYV